MKNVFIKPKILIVIMSFIFGALSGVFAQNPIFRIYNPSNTEDFIDEVDGSVRIVSYKIAAKPFTPDYYEYRHIKFFAHSLAKTELEVIAEEYDVDPKNNLSTITYDSVTINGRKLMIFDMDYDFVLPDGTRKEIYKRQVIGHNPEKKSDYTVLCTSHLKFNLLFGKCWDRINSVFLLNTNKSTK